MVVGDQGSLDGGADLPVVPDAGVEGEEPLDDAGPESCGDAAAVAFEAELVLQDPDDGLDPLAEPVRDGRGCFSSLRAGRIRVSPRLSPAKNSSVPCPDPGRSVSR